LKNIHFLFLFLLYVTYNVYSEEAALTIQTSSGFINGTSKNGVISWNNVPYAQPPVGDLRWKAPRPYQ